jgi:hypothetical protein
MAMLRLAAPSPLQLMAAGCALGLCACSAGSSAAPFSLDGGLHGDPLDRDGDGLCDASEIELGTNPMLADTDGDGLPDALEAIAGSDPENPAEPSPDRVAHLSVESGSLELLLDSSVEGQGVGAQGELVARNALDAKSRRASDYYRGSVAVAGIPPDNVRNVSLDQPRFGMVLGRVRLRYRLEFSVEPGTKLPCALGLPFDYVTRDNSGQVLARESGLLIVSESATMPTAAEICRPVACI